MINGLGMRLKELREARHLSQTEVAKSLKLNPTVISQYESDSIQPSVDMIIALSSFYHVTTDYLLGLENNHSVDIDGLTSNEIDILSHINEIFDKYVNDTHKSK